MTLSLRREPIRKADVQVADRDVSLTAPQLHRALLEAGLEDEFLEALREIPGDTHGEMKAVLRAEGIDALEGLFTDLVVRAAAATDWALEEPEDDERVERAEEARQELVTLARQLGTGQTSANLRSSREDLSGGAVALLRAAERTPVVEVTLTAAFTSRRPEQRRDVLEFLEQLAIGCDVAIVATGQARRCLEDAHRDQLPGHLTDGCNPGRGSSPLAVAQEALGSLEREGTATSILRALSGVPSGSLSYADLRRELRLESADDSLVPQTAKRLEERYGLAERIQRPDGETVLSLLSAGEAVVEELETDEEINRNASTSWTSTGPDDTPPKILPPCRVTPPAHDGGEETAETADRDSAAGDAVERPAGEAAAATQETPYAEGWVDVAYMGRPRHVAAAGAAASGEIGLVDSAVVRDEDGRRPYWSYDSARDELVVGAEYHNPMQMWTTLARSLASEQTLEEVLTADRLGENLEGLEASDRELLRDARCVGWLSDDVTGEGVVEELRSAREDLLDLTSELKAENYEDRNEHRGEILRLALGLAGTIVHLLDLLDVEVVREVQVPEYGRHFSREDRRADLARTIATGAAIQSRYGHFSAFRQLFETREEKRSAALNPRVRPDDAVGSLVGSFVLVGDGLGDLEDELAAHLEGPRELHEDAPEFGVRIPIGTASREATARAVQRLLSWKGMRPCREAVDVLHGFASDPYAVCEGLNRALAHESQSRGIHLDEVRRALSVLDEDRLLPEAAAAARKGVAALLEADRPISQAELARRAGISTQSWRNHREALVEAGIVQETSEGWRVCLPFSSERGRDVEAFLPWFLVENPEINGMKRSTRHPTDVLMELVFQFDAEATGAVEEFAYSGKWPPEPEDVDGTIEALGVGPIWELICAGCGVGSDPAPLETVMGSDEYVQAALPTA